MDFGSACNLDKTLGTANGPDGGGREAEWGFHHFVLGEEYRPNFLSVQSSLLTREGILATFITAYVRGSILSVLGGCLWILLRRVSRCGALVAVWLSVLNLESTAASRSPTLPVETVP